MQTPVKEQTAFRFDKEMLNLMKLRAKSQEISLNTYVRNLIMKDLLVAREFPKVNLNSGVSERIRRFSGILPIPTEEDMKRDERLERIWNR